MKNNAPIIIRGLPVSKGIAIGKCRVLEHGQNIVEKQKIEKKDINKELNRLEKALKTTLVDLKKIKRNISPSIKKNIGLFLDTHILLIKDDEFILNVKNKISSKLYSSEWSLYDEYLSIKSSFDDMEDDYIKQRIEDVSHVVKMILKNLHNKKSKSKQTFANMSNYIVVTDDLSPADVLLAHESQCIGLISEFGGRSSHSSILTRSLELPSVVSVKHALSLFKNDDVLVLDGNEGLIIINPDKQCKNHYTKLQEKFIQNKKILSNILQKKNITLDKEKIEIMANLELPQELKIISKKNIDGIGLFRTEYLYTDRKDFPSESEQYSAYKKIVEKMDGKPVIFRTLDIGSDKEIPENIKTGAIARNPALGLRGIRYSLNNQSIFINQIKAILRAGVFGNVKIMLPMITTFSEIKKTFSLINKTKDELLEKKIKFNKKVEIGIMVEVPSCAILANKFANHVDFFSIGTNDLVQYTLAIDRVDDEVNYLYNPLNSAVLSLIKTVIDAGVKNNIPVALCGEMAGDINYTKLLLGLGLKSFSMHPSAIPEIKNIIINSNLSELKATTKKIIESDDTNEKIQLVQKLNNSH
tara:strand:+ start:3704 stop:5455 length:1752 start_codon:yes stop_codon:yes gene_type:complete